MRRNGTKRARERGREYGDGFGSDKLGQWLLLVEDVQMVVMMIVATGRDHD
jgi:hypothetical protein